MSNLREYCQKLIDRSSRLRKQHFPKDKKRIKELLMKYKKSVITIPDTKVCTKCNREKSLSEFNKDVKGKYGHSAICRSCQRIIAKKYRTDNAEKIKAAKHAYHLAHRDELREKKRIYYQNNKEHHLETCRKYAQSHKKELSKYYKQYAKEHKHELTDYRASYGKKYRRKYPKAIFAKKMVGIAIKRGYLIRPVLCEECGDKSLGKDIQAHHDNYDYPLKIRWLCRSCHKLWHGKHGPGANKEGACVSALQRQLKKPPVGKFKRYRVYLICYV